MSDASRFVTAYSTKTGRKQRVPAHYFDNPKLSKGLSKVPTQAEREHPTSTPSEAWTVPQLRAYAAEHGVDLTGATNKSDVLSAINQHPATGGEEE